VAENLRARLHAEVTAEVPPSHPLNPESYIEGLKGWSLLRHRTEPSVREARARFERAIELDARNARAHVGLAIAENSVSLFTREPRADILRASRGLVERALELDPNLAEAHAYLGRLIMFEYRWEEAERELARAISLNPSSASAHGSYARLLVEEGRFEDALRELSLAEESDPLDPGPAGAQAQILTNLGRLDEARAKLQKQGELTQKGLGYQLGVAWYALTTRDFATALRHIERAEAFGPGEPESLCLRGIYYALAGRRNEAEEVLERLKGLPESKGFRNDALAQVCACLGRTEECFRYLEQGVEKRGIFFSNWRGDPILAPVLNDPRFHELLERANLE
jgi:tetratricopeptide (TPR) repeat protein